MARIAGINIPQNKLVYIGLTISTGLVINFLIKFVLHWKFQEQKELMN